MKVYAPSAATVRAHAAPLRVCPAYVPARQLLAAGSEEVFTTGHAARRVVIAFPGVGVGLGVEVPPPPHAASSRGSSRVAG
ncbi:hypothetical protein GCM10008019_12060 [Deinococcus soli (ex Cha et al. 2016)]|nr:hypothetical protein GCM10008019_12060 [Deinococcus soli (ex Cha et al. 2016)]